MNNPSVSLSKGSLFSKVSLLLTISFALSAAGAYMGQGITSIGAMIGLGLLFFFGSFGVRIAAKSSVNAGVFALGAWTFVTGLFLGPTVHHYVASIGPNAILVTTLGSAGLMAACGAIGALSGINFSRLGNFLMIALLGLIVVGIWGIFVPLSHTVNIAYCIIGIVIFTGFFLVDFFRLANSENTWDAAFDLTMNIFLDFINVLLLVWRLYEALTGSKK